MRLTDLMTAAGVTGGPAQLPPGIEISGLTADSRAVAPGYLFAALPGSRADGRQFIADAIQRGAAAILAPADEAGAKAPADKNVVILTDTAPRRRFALLAAAFFGAQPRVVCAVTGTNGKTSVAWFARQIWARLGHRAASLGTLGVHAPGHTVKGSLTTPDPVALHRALAELAQDGIDHLVLEASSHGIEQSRLDGVRLTAAAFTNLTRDHLDYHKDLDGYRAAKLRLFDTLLPVDGTAVLNADSPEFDTFASACRARKLKIMGYGRNGEEIRLEDRTLLPDGQRLALAVGGQTFSITLPLVGAFQAENAMAALGLVIASGDDADAAVSALETLEGAPGRLEHVAALARDAAIFVDYAHTPDALATVLTAIRPHARGKLVVVFGCGGDRDRGKRPEMGRIAAEMADRAIVTDDNPRGEDPAAIRAEIMTACPGATEIGDRAQAIYHAVAELGPGDLLVIAGKGHETGQIVGDTVLPFDDGDIARAAVAAVEGRAT